MIPGTILVVDDEKNQRQTLAGILGKWGHQVHQAATAEEALGMLDGQPVDLILTDLRMPGMSGVELLEKAVLLRPDVAVIVMTAFGTIEGAVEAMRKGAKNFLTKPIDLDQLEVYVQQTLGMRRLEKENRNLRRRLEETTAGFRLIGNSPALAGVLARAGRAAETDATVLIQGESGTGKELLARSIHDLSHRSDGPFVAVNCAALPESLLESELFGHTRGSFTGADKDRLGRVQTAAGGTLFLDEIGDIPPSMQVKLLRFLQDHEFTPVGSDKNWRADVRVITATHRDLPARIEQELFREDLYFRLNVVNLELPPLRDRREDIPQLAAHFLERYAKRYDRPARTFSSEAMACLMSHEFRGNVRELENIIEQTVVMAPGDMIHLQDLPPTMKCSASPSDPAIASLTGNVNGDLPGLLEALEKRIVLDTLAEYSGNQSNTARHLGLTESGLRYKLNKWKTGESGE
jgi:DNA-binding NtrC family response regulator